MEQIIVVRRSGAAIGWRIALQCLQLLPTHALISVGKQLQTEIADG